MHSQPARRLALALLLFFGVATTAVAAALALVFGVMAWIACVALLLSALLVAGLWKLYDALREARWNAGHRLR